MKTLEQLRDELTLIESKREIAIGEAVAQAYSEGRNIFDVRAGIRRAYQPGIDELVVQIIGAMEGK